MVTAFRPGETITIVITETVPHPGHYRVALAANNRTELPSDPAVTAGSTACGSAVIQTTPVYPVLADGLLVHTSPFAEPQTMRVTLPSNVTCTNCTLQVIEFMSSHGLNNPGGCFYHHCANISIQGASMDAGGPVTRDAAADTIARDTSSPPYSPEASHDEASSNGAGGSEGGGRADSGSNGGSVAAGAAGAAGGAGSAGAGNAGAGNAGAGGGGAGNAGAGGGDAGAGGSGGAPGQPSSTSGSAAMGSSGANGVGGGSAGSTVDSGISSGARESSADSTGCSCSLGRASGSKRAVTAAVSLALGLAGLRRRSRRS